VSLPSGVVAAAASAALVDAATTPGGHRAGYFEFLCEGVQTGVEPPDAPARLRIVYGEVLNDIAESFDDYK
jgi:hypothetical protein